MTGALTPPRLAPSHAAVHPTIAHAGQARPAQIVGLERGAGLLPAAHAVLRDGTGSLAVAVALVPTPRRGRRHVLVRLRSTQRAVDHPATANVHAARRARSL